MQARAPPTTCCRILAACRWSGSSKRDWRYRNRKRFPIAPRNRRRGVVTIIFPFTSLPPPSMQDYLSRHFKNRRSLLLAAASVPVSNKCSFLGGAQSTQVTADASFRDLETSL